MKPSDSILPLLQSKYPHLKLEFQYEGNKCTLVINDTDPKISGNDKGIKYFQDKGILNRVIDGICLEIDQYMRSLK